MSNTEIIVTLSLYILSMTTSLVMSFAFNKGKQHNSIVPLYIHIILFIVFLVLSFIPAGNYHMVFLFFFCSGIICFGYYLRSAIHFILRVYFSVYIISIFVFFISPSLLVRITSFNLQQESFPEKFNLAANYYLEKESSLMKLPDSLTTYKITQQFGIFHKTLARKIRFNHRPDSIHVINFESNKEAIVRSYYAGKNSTFAKVDSSELTISFIENKKEIIQKRK